jgi:hypothetical protein
MNFGMKATVFLTLLSLSCSLAMSAETNDVTESNWGPVESGFQLSLSLEKHTFTNNEPIVAILLLRNVTNANLWLTYLPRWPVGFSDGPVGFNVVSEKGICIPQHDYRIENVISENSPATLMPETQAKFVERLDKRFDLTNGIYSIHAVVDTWSGPFPKIDTNHLIATNIEYAIMHAPRVSVRVVSADVKIKIWNSP